MLFPSLTDLLLLLLYRFAQEHENKSIESLPGSSFSPAETASRYYILTPFSFHSS